MVLLARWLFARDHSATNHVAYSYLPGDNLPIITLRFIDPFSRIKTSPEAFIDHHPSRFSPV